MKKQFDSLVLEVTRRCNMNCAHCLRGDAEEIDMTEDIVDAILSEVSSIGNLTFSGGEPTLNTRIIQYALDECKRRNIPVYSFFIATNGKAITEEFAILCLRWYAYCMKCGGDPECSAVTISSDMFHEKISGNNVQLMQGLGFYSELKTTDFRKTPLINLGRARSLSGFLKSDPFRSEKLSAECDNGNLAVESTILITAAGDILPECDYEYDEVDTLTMGSVYDFANNNPFKKYEKGAA